jgi:RNA polymerase sigma-70 factor (ECF subfamily)
MSFLVGFGRFFQALEHANPGRLGIYAPAARPDVFSRRSPDYKPRCGAVGEAEKWRDPGKKHRFERNYRYRGPLREPYQRTREIPVLDPSDMDLVRSAAAGDDGAFHALIDRHAGAMYRVALSLSKNRADAEDLMQEATIGAYRGLKNFAGRSSVKTWLLQIMTRQAAKAWHKTRHHRGAESLHSPTGEGERQDDANLATRSSASAVEQRLDVMAVLQKMSQAHREILVLREIRGLSYEEIAEVLSVPRGTVESRLSRARAEFRERFGETNL